MSFRNILEYGRKDINIFGRKMRLYITMVLILFSAVAIQNIYFLIMDFIESDFPGAIIHSLIIAMEVGYFTYFYLLNKIDYGEKV